MVLRKAGRDKTLISFVDSPFYKSPAGQFVTEHPVRKPFVYKEPAVEQASTGFARAWSLRATQEGKPCKPCCSSTHPSRSTPPKEKAWPSWFRITAPTSISGGRLS